MVTVRLSVSHDGMPSKENRYDEVFVPPINKKLETRVTTPTNPAVRLAHVPGAQGDNVLLGQRGVDALPDDCLPGLLVSYFFLPKFIENRHRYRYRNWVLDSGAFSAHNSGAVIELQKYIDTARKLLEEDPTLVEVYALDVIGDWRASLANCEEMWSQGIEAIPTFHYGSPWEVLVDIAKNYPKVAIGGCVGKRDKDKFAGQCFSRIWPKKIHGFGFGAEKSLMLYPWHSVDATNWEIQPCKYGRWQAFGGQRVSVRGSSQNLKAEVEYYLGIEKKAREKWKKQMQVLNDLEEPRPDVTRKERPTPRQVQQMLLPLTVRLAQISTKRKLGFEKEGYQ